MDSVQVLVFMHRQGSNVIIQLGSERQIPPSTGTFKLSPVLRIPRSSGRRREDSRVRRLPVVVAERSERAWHDSLPVGHEAGGSNAEDVTCPISNSATDSSDPC
jgi:hypothetical protein